MAVDIAIIGIAAELPSASYSDKNLDHDSFFKFLLDGGEAYEHIPSDRFNIDAWKGNEAGQVSVDKGAFLKGIELFDNVEFGISARDARAMAPSTRKLIETCFLALLDSGIDYRSKDVGCYTAGTAFDLLSVSNPDEFDAEGSFAGLPSMIANRVSFHLDLLGPSVPTDTACSSSFTALHLAVQAVQSGDCEAAVVGGCQLNQRFMDWIMYSQGSLLAKDGKCKPFDASADGFARGEGVVSVVIKPLVQAMRDNDHIYATILGTAINSGGFGGPPGAPVAEAQCRAMKQAFIIAGRAPQEVDFIECHATGTTKGDPTELNWVGQHFQREDELLVGSVKGNIGHTEVAAFLASLSKTISIFQHRVIPPNVNLKIRNPAIRWDEYKLRVPTSATPLPCRSGARSLIAMASSGIGGSNGHIVLESPPESQFKSYDTTTSRPVLLMASGLSPRSASTIASSLTENIALHAGRLRSLSKELGRRSRQMSWRSFAVLGPDISLSPRFSLPALSMRSKPPIVFVFSGQGPQHIEMGRELFQAFPPFRNSILESDKVFRKVTGKSIIENHGLFGGHKPSSIREPWPISLTLPSITIFQMALFDLLNTLGIKPDIVVGHSAGETAVLYASGAGTKGLAVELAIARGAAFSSIEEMGGSMAALSCGPEEAIEIMREVRSDCPGNIVELACYNSPSAVAIAGMSESIERVLQSARARDVLGTRIRTRVPVHCSLMESCRDEYNDSLLNLFSRYAGDFKPSINTYSTLTGKQFCGVYDGKYFWNNTRSPVLFTQAIQNIVLSAPSSTFIEIAPHPVLSAYITSMANESSKVLSGVRRPKAGKPHTEHQMLLEMLGELTVVGYNCVDFAALSDERGNSARFSLPSYPFVQRPFALYPDTDGRTKEMTAHRGPLNHDYLRINKETHSSLAQHLVGSEPIMPAAGFLEMALEFGASTLMNVNLRSIFSLSSERPVKVSVELDGAYWTVKSIPPTSSGLKEPGISKVSNRRSYQERLHVDGYLSFDKPERDYPTLDLQAIRRRCTSSTGSAFYSLLSSNLTYGPLFQRVEDCHYRFDEALVSIRGMDEELAADGKYRLHPAILDACFHVAMLRPFHGNFDDNHYYLPSRVESVIIHQPSKVSYFPVHIYAHCTVKTWTAHAVQYDIAVVDNEGNRLCTLEGFEGAKHYVYPYPDIQRRFGLFHQPMTLAHKIDRPNQINFDFYDTTELYLALDKLAKVYNNRAARENPSNEPYANNERSSVSTSIAHGKYGEQFRFETLRQQWPRHFELLDEKLSSTEAIQTTDARLSSHRHPHLDYSVSICIEILRMKLSLLVQTGSSRVVKLFIASSNDALAKNLYPLFSEFPSLFFHYFTNSSFQIAQTDRGLMTECVLHSFDFMRPISDQDIEGGTFDLVVSFNATPASVDRRVIINTLSSLLVPGGSFILTDREGYVWENGLPGVVWYDTIIGKPDLNDLLTVDGWTALLANANFSRPVVYYNSAVDPFHFTIDSQKSSSWPLVGYTPIFQEYTAYVFVYHQGHEMELQAAFSSMDTLDALDVWILADEGVDGDAAMGFTRALRRELLSWVIRLVVFPVSYDRKMRYDALQRLPDTLANDLEIVISTQGDILVPKIAPLLPPGDGQGTALTAPQLSDNFISIRILHYTEEVCVWGFLAVVVGSAKPEFREGSLVAGLTPRETEKNSLVSADIATLSTVSPSVASALHLIPALAFAILIGALAEPIRTLNQRDRLKSRRILLTHSDTAIGRALSQIYSIKNVNIVEVDASIGLFDFARTGCGSFDIIVSGYVDPPFVQVAKTLEHPEKGRLFLWNDREHGLLSALKKDPWFIGDALSDSLQWLLDRIDISHMLSCDDFTTFHKSVGEIMEPQFLRQAVFRSDRSYLLLGGIGSLGAQVALWMYNRGARHIILTSRSGESGLRREGNVLPRRIVGHLMTCADLKLRLERVDAASYDDMSILVETLSPELGGCMLLTATTSDGSFDHLREDDFTRVSASKMGVFNILKVVVDLRRLEFLVVFSSMSGVFGNGGQTNYCSAITGLDGMTRSLSNAFSFVIPGIKDSSLLLAGDADARAALMSHLIEWAISTEDMIRWLEDGICKLQSGQSFWLYIPDLDWGAVNRTLGVPRVGEHFATTSTLSPAFRDNSSDELAETVMNQLGISPEDFSPEVPFTSYGLDSISASRLSFSLRSFIKVSQIQLLADMTLQDLQAQMSTMSDITTAGQEDSLLAQRNVRKIQEILSEFSVMYKNFSSRPGWTHNHSPISSQVVILTGSTGALGSNIFCYLIDSPDVKKIYALNRRSRDQVSLQKRQIYALEQQGLSSSYAISSKVVFLEYDLSASDLAIPHGMMNELLSTVTHIIHNAWRVDFYAPFSAFEELIYGTHKLIEIALKSTLSIPPRLSFISTIGICRNTLDRVVALENPIEESRINWKSGYIQSKWVAERMLQLVRKEALLHTTTIRVGQLTGGPNGAWDPSHWMPSMVKSGLYLNCLPSGDDPISWVPMNAAAAIIVEMRDSSFGTLHLVHPHPVSWMSIMKPIATALEVPLVSYAEWFERLDGNLHFTSTSQISGENPALKLVDFFRQGLEDSEHIQMTTESMRLLPKVSFEQAKEASTTFRCLPQLGTEDVDSWMCYWKKIGFLV